MHTIRHEPFRWAVTFNELEDMLLEQSLRAGNPNNLHLEECSGYSHFVTVSNAFGSLIKTMENEPKNCVLLHYLVTNAIRIIGEEAGVWPDGYKSLLALADYAISRLRFGDNEALRKIARMRSDWPCSVTLREAAKQRIVKREEDTFTLREWLEHLELGADVPQKVLSNVESNRIARLMINVIEENRRRLAQREEALKLKTSDPDKFRERFKLVEFPAWASRCGSLKPLSEKGAWKEWFEVGWEALLVATEGHPERYKSLEKIGEYRAKISHQRGHKKAKNRKIEKSIAANIKDGIRWKIQEAFRRLAKASQ
jgi:hypothetical protein